MSGQCGGERTAGAVSMAGLDELSLQNIKKSSVIEQVSGPLIEQMSTFDQDMLASEAVNHFGRSSGIG
jgi:hypothetical protein